LDRSGGLRRRDHADRRLTPATRRSRTGAPWRSPSVRDKDEKKIANRFAPQLVPKVLSTVPGITYLSDQGRPRASDVVGYWPALISREKVPVRVEVSGKTAEVAAPPRGKGVKVSLPPKPPPTLVLTQRRQRVPLSRICLARSGDKGDTANIGVIGRSRAIYAWMLNKLTSYTSSVFTDIAKYGH
jgi:hypothetical protein